VCIFNDPHLHYWREWLSCCEWDGIACERDGLKGSDKCSVKYTKELELKINIELEFILDVFLLRQLVFLEIEDEFIELKWLVWNFRCLIMLLTICYVSISDITKIDLKFIRKYLTHTYWLNIIPISKNIFKQKQIHFLINLKIRHL